MSGSQNDLATLTKAVNEMAAKLAQMQPPTTKRKAVAAMDDDDPEDFSDLVELAIKTALTPLLERVVALEATQSMSEKCRVTLEKQVEDMRTEVLYHTWARQQDTAKP